MHWYALSARSLRGSIRILSQRRHRYVPHLHDGVTQLSVLLLKVGHGEERHELVVQLRVGLFWGGVQIKGESFQGRLVHLLEQCAPVLERGEIDPDAL